MVRQPPLDARQLSIGVTAVAKAAVSLFGRAAQEQRPSIVCPILLQLFSGMSFQACMQGKYQWVPLQWQKAVVSLFCKTAQEQRPSIVSPALLQVVSGFSIQACMKGKYQ